MLTNPYICFRFKDQAQAPMMESPDGNGLTI